MWSSQISEWLAQLLRVSTTDSAEKVHCMMAMSLNAQIQSFFWRHAARQMDVPGKPRRRNIYAHVWYLELRSSPLWNNNIRIFPIPGLTLTFERNVKPHDQFYTWHQTTLTNKIRYPCQNNVHFSRACPTTKCYNTLNLVTRSARPPASNNNCEYQVLESKPLVKRRWVEPLNVKCLVPVYVYAWTVNTASRSFHSAQCNWKYI